MGCASAKPARAMQKAPEASHTTGSVSSVLSPVAVAPLEPLPQLHAWVLGLPPSLMLLPRESLPDHARSRLAQLRRSLLAAPEDALNSWRTFRTLFWMAAACDLAALQELAMQYPAPVGNFLMLSAKALASDHRELACQLVGRFTPSAPYPVRDVPLVTALLKDAKTWLTLAHKSGLVVATPLLADFDCGLMHAHGVVVEIGKQAAKDIRLSLASANRECLVSVGSQLTLFDLGSGAALAPPMRLEAAAYQSFALSPCARWVLQAPINFESKAFKALMSDVQTGRNVLSWEAMHCLPCFSRDGNWLCFIDTNNQIAVVSVPLGTPLVKSPLLDLSVQLPSSLHWYEPFRIVIFGTLNNNELGAVVLKSTDLSLVSTWTSPSKRVFISPDGLLAVTTDANCMSLHRILDRSDPVEVCPEFAFSNLDTCTINWWPGNWLQVDDAVYGVSSPPSEPTAPISMHLSAWAPSKRLVGIFPDGCLVLSGDSHVSDGIFQVYLAAQSTCNRDQVVGEHLLPSARHVLRVVKRRDAQQRFLMVVQMLLLSKDGVTVMDEAISPPATSWPDADPIFCVDGSAVAIDNAVFDINVDTEAGKVSFKTPKRGKVLVGPPAIVAGPVYEVLPSSLIFKGGGELQVIARHGNDMVDPLPSCMKRFVAAKNNLVVVAPAPQRPNGVVFRVEGGRRVDVEDSILPSVPFTPPLALSPGLDTLACRVNGEMTFLPVVGSWGEAKVTYEPVWPVAEAILAMRRKLKGVPMVWHTIMSFIGVDRGFPLLAHKGHGGAKRVALGSASASVGITLDRPWDSLDIEGGSGVWNMGKLIVVTSQKKHKRAAVFSFS